MRMLRTWTSEPSDSRQMYPFLARPAAHPPLGVRPVGDERGALNGEDVPVARVEPLRMIPEHDLDLDRLREGLAAHGERRTVDEKTGVSALVEVLPLQLQDVVLVHPLRPEHPRGLSGTDDDAVFDLPCGRGAVDVDPAGEVLAVEERDEAVVLRRGDSGGGTGGQEQSEPCGRFHRVSP